MIFAFCAFWTYPILSDFGVDFRTLWREGAIGWIKGVGLLCIGAIILGLISVLFFGGGHNDGSSCYGPPIGCLD